MVVVPGIGGSVLERKGAPVWGQSPLGIAARALDPSVLARFDGDGIRATGLVRAPTVLPGFAALRAYDELVRRISNRFANVVVDGCHPDAAPVPGADLICVPYDFRRSVVDCADHLARTVADRLDVAGLSERERQGRVVVIAHSMGGLVARWWLGPGGGGPLCQSLLTLGTPHRGAPKALDWLVNGVRLGGVRLDGATDVVRSWPAAYELLPRYEAVLDTPSGRHLRPHEVVAAGFDQDRAERALSVHRAIERSWDGSPGRPGVTTLLGRFQPTLERADLTGGRLRVEKRAAEWLDVDDWAGDGTVPWFSAVPLELDGAGERDRWRNPSARHSALPALDAVIEWLEAQEGRPTAAVRGGADAGRPALGLDVDEWYPAGERVEMAAVARGPGDGLEGDGSGARLWVTARAVGGGGMAGQPVELHPDADGRWAGGLGGLVPGAYELELSAPGRGGGEARPVREMIAVVDA